MATHPRVGLSILPALLAFACGEKRLQLRAVESTTVELPSAAGIGWADITPPVGGLLAGHGPNGLLARGRRGLLQCEALYLSDDAGESLSWIACDLAHPSTLLQREVASRVRELAAAESNARCMALGTDRIVLSARHGHGTPGHHYDALNYTDPIPVGADGFVPYDPGYDAEMVRFLTYRIAGAVMRSCKDADAGGSPMIRWTRVRDFPSITTNRSLASHCTNPRPMPGDGTATTCNDDTPDPRLEVDSTIHLLEVARNRLGAAADREPDETVALVAIFGIHPTTVPNGNDAYHSDLYEAARTRVAIGWDSLPAPNFARSVTDRDLAGSSGDGPELGRVMFVNGAEGDVSPAWPLGVPQIGCGSLGFDGARTIGMTLGDAILAGLAARTPAASPYEAVTLGRAYADVLFAGWQTVAGSVNDWAPPPCETGRFELIDSLVPGRLAFVGALGTAAAAGAEDGPTMYRYPPFGFAEGQKEEALAERTAHSPKLKLTGGILGNGPCSFPEVAPIALLEIGSERVLALPGEPTTTAAMEIARSAPDQAGLDRKPPILVSLSSGYLQYFATATEYETQSYEGGSTLYGSYTVPFLTKRVAELEAALAGGSSAASWHRSWATRVHVLPRRYRLELDQGGEPKASPAALRRLAEADRPDHVVQAPPEACGALQIPLCGEVMALRTPFGVGVEILNADGTPLKNRLGVNVSDATQDVEVRQIRDDDAAILWYPEPGTCAPGSRACARYSVGSMPTVNECFKWDGQVWSAEDVTREAARRKACED